MDISWTKTTCTIWALLVSIGCIINAVHTYLSSKDMITLESCLYWYTVVDAFKSVLATSLVVQLKYHQLGFYHAILTLFQQHL